jgi:hypothetical protein
VIARRGKSGILLGSYFSVPSPTRGQGTPKQRSNKICQTKFERHVFLAQLRYTTDRFEMIGTSFSITAPISIIMEPRSHLRRFLCWREVVMFSTITLARIRPLVSLLVGMLILIVPPVVPLLAGISILIARLLNIIIADLSDTHRGNRAWARVTTRR